MPRFYLADALQPGQNISLPENVIRHLQVLRVREGEEITLFNGNGHSYPTRLLSLAKRQAVAEVLSEQTVDNESPLAISLIQAVSSGERMDFTLQKSVEMGVTEIFPVTSARSIVKLSGERAEKRQERWQEIVIAACEQCGRNRIPTVHPLLPLSQRLQQLPQSDVRLLMGLHHPTSLKAIQPAPQRITLMIGPEGGWSPEEEAAAFQTGFQSILLGKRVLRTETAALAAIAAMQTLWGDF
jgi:16S rRNA (uracil1498-N3)-methyltransferase